MPNACRSLKSFKDPVHGYADICSELAPLIDSWLLQRLRHVRQTAFAYLVYHGMEHSRFNHSLGAAHLAREVLDFVAGNTRVYYSQSGGEELASLLQRSVAVFQLAVLLHDVGHLPFSHSSEVGLMESKLVFRVEGFERLPLRHEAYTYALAKLGARMAEESGLEPSLSPTLLQDIELLLKGPKSAERTRDLLGQCASHVFHKLIAGGLDVDRMDYLLRDSIYAGVRYGVFDIDRLVRMMLATPLLTEDGSLSERACQVAVLDKGISIIESFLLARFYMFSEVYLHRVVEAYNAVYARLFSLLALEGIVTPLGGGGRIELPAPADIEKEKDDALTAWRALDDITMMGLIRSVASGSVDASGEARALAQMLAERKHPKFHIFIEDQRLWGVYMSYLYGGSVPKDARPILDELADLQREKPLVIVRPLRVDLVSLEELGIYDRATGEVVLLEEAEKKLRDPHGLGRLRSLAELSLYRIAVFAPKQYEGEAEKARKLLAELKAALDSSQKR
ncbi:MAG: HD domain-containing protein [Thermoproteota archaeon]